MFIKTRCYCHIEQVRVVLFFLLFAYALFGYCADNFADAEASDPNTLGFMQGFPPPLDKRVMQPDANFFSFPKLRWSDCHIRELMPTKQVSRGLSAPAPLSINLDKGIDKVMFTPIDEHQSMSWRQALSENYTDAVLILHKGQIVYEYYNGCMTPSGKHAAMSMTKSLTGLLAEILVAEKNLDDKLQVGSLIPELTKSAFGNATVRQVMDMTTALDYSEDYADPNADIWIYSAAANPLPKPKSYAGPIGYYEYLQTVKPLGKHGVAFAYKTINTDVLGWIISRVTGKSITDLLSERIWSQMGAEQDAYFTIDAIGTPFAGGGLSAGLRDLARIGLLMLNKGEVDGKRLFPVSVVENIQRGGDKSRL